MRREPTPLELDRIMTIESILTSLDVSIRELEKIRAKANVELDGLNAALEEVDDGTK